MKRTYVYMDGEFVERKRDRGMVGNIYRGKVTRVLPGMQAAFAKKPAQVLLTLTRGRGSYFVPVE